MLDFFLSLYEVPIFRLYTSFLYIGTCPITCVNLLIRFSSLIIGFEYVMHFQFHTLFS